MRGALASFLCCCSLLGKWLSWAATAIFAASWRNQTANGWYLKQNRGFIKPPPKIGNEAAELQSPGKILRKVEWRRCRRHHQKKRSLQSIEIDGPEESPLKRRRSQPKKQWRFWLPHSSELEGEESVQVPFAGEKSPNPANWVEQHVPIAGLGQGLAIGEGIDPLNSHLGCSQMIHLPVGGVTPDVMSVKTQTPVQKASIAAGEKMDGPAASSPRLSWCGGEIHGRLRLSRILGPLFW
ncbi:unnamed protein product [Linum trigynum]|uniref:Uncharacterized protein n=1 Tax=Linum trigynum TaxID=586398 RepID=A0AAV2D8A1_9ROSI